MQPLNPQTIVFPVVGIPYRCNTNISQLVGVRLSSYNEDFPFQQDENMDEADQNHEEIEFDKSTGKYTLSTYVLRKFYGNLIGKGREIQREIEINSKTSITIPHKQSSSEIISIRGNSKASVIMGHNLISAKIDLAKQNLPFSHFFNIPLAFCESFVERMNGIIDHIFEKYGTSRGLDRSIVMDPQRMHLTLLCIKLFSSDDEI
ncbi:MAG: hypothetical protein EZS28_016525 [Streblomastix strix]|uniref:K Homology domain-containing protein n=1 Tax=Streblomastix strix TaxID=222440 RepID=A0A5J4W029_9EUKA|nr:MAG: hypothetical protein EZS28_016525 [Streblomastix strix]